MSLTKNELLRRFDGSGQEHVLDGFDALSDDAKRQLAHQITHCNLDFVHLNTVLCTSVFLLDHPDDAAAACMQPPPPNCIWDVQKQLSRGEDAATRSALAPGEHQRSALWHGGLDLIARGGAAVLLLAGGSGTRLGVSIPKGLFVCEALPQQKSLFEIDCDKILRTQAMAAAAFPERDAESIRIPLLIMTSEENDATTQQFFVENDYFGLCKDQVMFFTQSSLPCYDEATGKILMAAQGKMCMAPGGNGGVYQALAHSRQGDGKTTLDSLRARGVEQVQIFSVDNILARIADPLFFGYACAEKAHVVVKTVPRAGPDERVGVFARRADTGTWGVVEYTEIGPTRAAERDAVTGELAYNCANIVSHCCSLSFLVYAAEKMRVSTQYHAARKTIATATGTRPTVKLEAFIFDMFQYCNDKALQPDPVGAERDCFRIMQVRRDEEFAPIKNADTAVTDTARTAAEALLRLHTRWAREALTQAHREAMSGDVSDKKNDASGAAGLDCTLYVKALEAIEHNKVQVEISSRVSLEGEGLGGARAKAIAWQIVEATAPPQSNSETQSEAVAAVPVVSVTLSVPTGEAASAVHGQRAHV